MARSVRSGSSTYPSNRLRGRGSSLSEISPSSHKLPCTSSKAISCPGDGLPESIADGDTPCGADSFDDFWVERFSGAGQVAQFHGKRFQIFQHEQAPYRWRSA